ncbi:inositol phospholipid synthesis and fat-storage-inducing TM-domain-containing protein [Ganoderma leucocontextum]|nr:inositol phospholipid synthesis and fat-storage-inducing TM-domain-containing protein [Ganoderma leucocontextum]
MLSSIRLLAVTATASIVLVGTIYSVVYDTYLDTSNPLVTALPHHLHATHYFASKKNPLNIYFTKKLWLWTTSAFLFLYMTSPSTARSRRRIVQFALATTVWLAFTSWFFGPPVFERLTASTGGECTLHLPSGAAVTIPKEYCFTRSTVSVATHTSLFPAAIFIPEGEWTGTPRLRKGHDVSGHVFLLTLSTLFLLDQLRWSFARQSGGPSSHKAGVAFTSVVIAMSLVALYTTSVYFHSPFEKFTGYVLGLASSALVQLPCYFSTSDIPNKAAPRRTVPLEKLVS